MHLLFLCEVHVFQHALKLVHNALVAHLTDIPPLKLDGSVTLRSRCVSQRHLFLNFVEIIKAVGPGQLTRWVGLKRVFIGNIWVPLQTFKFKEVLKGSNHNGKGHLATSPAPFFQPPDHLVQLQEDLVRIEAIIKSVTNDYLDPSEDGIFNQIYLFEVHPFDLLPI